MFAVIAMLGPWVVLIVVAGTIIQTLLSIKQVKVSTIISKEYNDKMRGINYGTRILYELKYAADMKTSSMGRYVLGWLYTYTKFIKQIYVRFIKTQVLTNIFNIIISHLTTLGTIAYIVRGIIKGNIGSIGDYAALIAASNSLAGQLRMLFGTVTSIARTSMQAEQAREFFDLPSVIETSTGENLPETPLSVEFRDVSFAYPEAEFCLKNLNLKIEPGEKIAIVGENGAGKSTMAKLLIRLYDVDGGSILINGKPLSHWDVFKLRENMQYYYPEADDETRLRALKTVGLERLNDLDKTVSREFLEDGIMLSGSKTRSWPSPGFWLLIRSFNTGRALQLSGPAGRI